MSRAVELTVKKAGTGYKITLPSIASDKAEIRIRIDESVPATGLTIHHTLAKGRYVFNLPLGYVLESSSLPAQIEVLDGHVVAGIVQGHDTPATVTLMFKQGSMPSPLVAFEGSFTALDNRAVSYQLLDPKDHQFRLWLEMYVDKPGQTHFYSQLRIPDHISDPVTLDVDRGVELPTRILSGKQATAIGDAPSPFPDEAQVLVADLGYSIPAHGSARIRSYQTATDPVGYRLVDPDNLRLDRFIARTRTQYILPAGWSLESMSQPGTISTTPDGRVIIDFVGNSAQAARLTIFAHRNAPTPQP